MDRDIPPLMSMGSVNCRPARQLQSTGCEVTIMDKRTRLTFISGKRREPEKSLAIHGVHPPPPPPSLSLSLRKHSAMAELSAQLREKDEQIAGLMEEGVL